MDLQTDYALADDAILSCDEADTPIAAWNLDELDQSSDLEFLRSASSRVDDSC